jgi:4-amino-4-deoxy-L-arabinose transferase-like glycosyltransferase
MNRWLLPTLIFLVALLPRLAPLGHYVTPDEPAWVYRSFRFGQALSRGDLSALPATGHPGVTTMWLGALGLQIHRWLAPEQAATHLEWLDGLAGLSPDSPAAFRHLAFFLPGGRVLVALSTSLGLVAVFALARRLWGKTAASLGALLLALDPFLAGHSGLLHLDGLLATTMTLSALAALLALAPPRAPYRWIVLSGLLGGLALLTKTPGGVLAPFVGLLLLVAVLTRRLSWRQALIALALWALAAGLTCLALYPALWAEPLATLRSMLDIGGRHVEGALRPIFFHGRYTYDPGLAFYAVVWLFRLSPLVLMGLPLALLTELRRPGLRRLALVALTLLALGFGLFVTLAAKKHDRYLLPAFPPLTLIAALGWERAGKLASGRLVSGKLVNWVRATNLPIPNLPIPNLLILTLLLAQLLLTLPYLSVPLGYFNPLLGGPHAALDWLPVGWGEGLGAAARWLNQQPQAERLIVATPSIPPFASLFVGQTVPLGQETLSQADYLISLPQPPVVSEANLPVVSEANLEDDGPSFERGEHIPAYDNQVGGVSYASVMRNPRPAEQAAYLSARAREGDLILLDAEAGLTHAYDGLADFVPLADARDAAGVAARLAALVSGREKLWYVALPAASPITARQVQAQLACYGQLLSTATIAGATISQIHLTTPPSPQSCDASRFTFHVSRFTLHASRFGDALALSDAYLPGAPAEPVAWPEPLSLLVRWEALAPIPADYRAVLHLKDEAGRIWVEGGQEILDGDYRRPSAWSPGDWSDQTFMLALPPALPPGRYSVALGVFDPASGVGLSAWDAEGRFAGLAVNLGPLSIAPPPQPPTPWDVVIAERLDPPPLAGPLALLGSNPPPPRIASGDRASFDLFWQAATAPGADYALRWRLSSSKGSDSLTTTVPLSPYPTAHWRDHELQQVRYDLPVSPELPAGDYLLSVNVLDADGVPSWADDLALAHVEILARERLFNLPSDIAYPLDMRLGDQVHLRGFDLPRQAQEGGGPLQVRPGDRIPLTLYWQADGPTELSYSVFVHLVGPDGMLHGQVDRPPADGAAPTHSWAPGQVIIDEVFLSVLPDTLPGTYHIAVGLYDPLSATRPPVYDATGAELPDGQILLPIEVKVE